MYLVLVSISWYYFLSPANFCTLRHMPAGALATPFGIQPPANAPGKAVEDFPSA